jgi:hypothetical protein
LVFRSYWGSNTVSLLGDQISMLGRAALVATVPLAYLLDLLTLEQLYVVGFLTGALTVLFGVANASLFQTIVARERFVEASSLLNGSRAVSFVAGPSVAGFLTQAVTAPGALVLDALSFVASGAFLARIRPVEPPPDDEESGVTSGFAGLPGPRSSARRSSRPPRSTSSTSSSSLSWSSSRRASWGCRRGRLGSSSASALWAGSSARPSLGRCPAGSASGRRSSSAASCFRCRSCSCRSRVARHRCHRVPVPASVAGHPHAHAPRGARVDP